MEKKHINVVCAIVKDGDKFLCMQRLRSHKKYESELWEFPGGKVKEGENDYEALIREIKEEMDWDIFVGKKHGAIDHEYPDYTITLTAYLCRGGETEYKLFSHLDAKWLTRDKLNTLRWTDADRKLIDLL